MAVTSAQIVDFLTANPGMSDAQIVTAMETYGVSPAQMAQAVGLNEGEVASRVAATIPQGQTITLGDTIVQPQYQVIGDGENQQIGGLENVYTYKVGENQAGGGYQQYTPTGELARTGVQQEVNAGQDFLKFLAGSAALFGGLGGGFENLFGGAGTVGADLAGLSGIPAGTGALTAAETAALYGTGGAGALGTVAGMGAGTGLTVGGAGGLGGATGAAGLGGSLGTGLTTAGAGGLGGLTGAAGLGGSLGAGLTTVGGLAGANTLLGGATLGSTLGNLGAGVGGSLLGSKVGTGLTAGNLANLFSGGLGTAGSLLQMQQSKEAAQQAQARIDAETAAAKAAAQFRPVGMTTRFGTSQFQVDPVTGQLTSAGYTLSPEAKNAQDRLVKLAEQGLVQAEGAQAQFAPLQTGATSLFTLGNKYLAQSPRDVAQNYLAEQMALLQPGRELELANLQTKLRNQGRMGLSVAQGGDLGATTPELQALFNARARQEAQLAANAQQYGQQNVAFGAGLLGTGAQTMGNYYAGQQAAYQPYTTALGQVQGLETAAQQPLSMGINLGQISSQAGANVGKLGLTGAGQSVALATGADATRNLAAQGLIAAGNPSAQFGQAIGGLFGGGLQSAFSGTGLGSSGFGTGLAYGNQDLGLFL